MDELSWLSILHLQSLWSRIIRCRLDFNIVGLLQQTFLRFFRILLQIHYTKTHQDSYQQPRQKHKSKPSQLKIKFLPTHLLLIEIYLFLLLSRRPTLSFCLVYIPARLHLRILCIRSHFPLIITPLSLGLHLSIRFRIHPILKSDNIITIFIRSVTIKCIWASLG